MLGPFAWPPFQMPEACSLGLENVKLGLAQSPRLEMKPDMTDLYSTRSKTMQDGLWRFTPAYT
jgi:hypothetical protein